MMILEAGSRQRTIHELRPLTFALGRPLFSLDDTLDCDATNVSPEYDCSAIECDSK